MEAQIKFAGFVIISCPLKPDSKAVIKELVSSSHQVRARDGSDIKCTGYARGRIPEFRLKSRDEDPDPVGSVDFGPPDPLIFGPPDPDPT